MDKKENCYKVSATLETATEKGRTLVDSPPVTSNSNGIVSGLTFFFDTSFLLVFDKLTDADMTQS